MSHDSATSIGGSTGTSTGTSTSTSCSGTRSGLDSGDGKGPSPRCAKAGRASGYWQSLSTSSAQTSSIPPLSQEQLVDWEHEKSVGYMTASTSEGPAETSTISMQSLKAATAMQWFTQAEMSLSLGHAADTAVGSDQSATVTAIARALEIQPENRTMASLAGALLIRASSSSSREDGVACDECPDRRDSRATKTLGGLDAADLAKMSASELHHALQDHEREVARILQYLASIG